jgi:hypothetical protein
MRDDSIGGHNKCQLLNSKTSYMKKIANFLFLLIIIGTSCYKENLSAVNNPECKEDAAFISCIKSSPPSSSSPYRFRVTLNGKQIVFDRQVNSPAFADTWTINYFKSVISAVRLNADSSMMIGMTYSTPLFQTSNLPYAIPIANACEGLTISISVIRPYDPQVCKPHEKTIWMSTGYTHLTLNCKIISFKNNVIEGTFEGKNVSNDGDILATDGYFNIKLRIEQE